ENPPYGILEGEGETRSSIEPAGRPFPTRLRLRFIRRGGRLPPLHLGFWIGEFGFWIGEFGLLPRRVFCDETVMATIWFSSSISSKSRCAGRISDSMRSSIQ